MKKTVYFLVVFLLLGQLAPGQHLASVDSMKYRINLPDYWRPGNKIWRILSDKLPAVCDELKDKELCGDDCNAWLSVEFEMSAPLIYDYLPAHLYANYANDQRSKPSDLWDIQTIYGFECSMYLMDQTGTVITRFIIVDTNEVWRISNKIKLASFSPAPLPATYIRRTPSRVNNGMIPEPVIQQVTPGNGQEGETPFAYINRNKEKLAPTLRDMFLVIDRKINSW